VNATTAPRPADRAAGTDRFRALFEANPGPLFVRSVADERFLAANSAYARLVGLGVDDIVGRTRYEFGLWIHPADFALVKATLADEGRFEGLEVRLHGPGSPVRRVLLSMAPITGFDEPAYLGAVTDVTVQREDAERMSSLFVRSPVAISLSDFESGRFLQVNAAFADFFGRHPRELAGHTGLELGIWRDVEQRESLMRRLGRERSFRNVEATFHGRSGTERCGLISMDLVELEGRETIVATIIDVTELRAVESQFRQAQKMEAIGRLAGGIAHDFNNILTAIRGYGELLAADLPPADPRREDLDEILKASDRASGLTRQLLAFSRRQVLQPSVLRLNDTVAGVVKMLQRVIGEDVRLVTSASPDLGATFADPGQIEQVLLNLAVNARDAMPDGGTLSIDLSNVDTPVSIGDLPAGEYVAMEVRDTGIGMDDQVRRRIFEPFFTTKGVGKGTGLGLATVYGVVKQSGGHVTVESAPGRGTAFRIYLPRTDDPAALTPRPADDPADAEPTGNESILLVEDDRAVREYITEALRQAGYAVTAAPDAERAVELATDPVDLIVTDVVMPGENGRDLVRRLQRGGRVGKVLLISGYPGDELVERGLQIEGDFLAKPFSTHALLRKVRDILDRR
jgi:PAS domain S-box-containing protein